MAEPNLIGSQLISTIYEAAIDTARWPDIAPHLANYIGSHQSIMIVSGPNGIEPQHVFTHGIDQAIYDEYVELLDEDIWLLGMLALDANSICISDQFIELTDYKKRRFFQEVCVPSDVAYMGGAVIQNDPGGVLLMACQRSAPSGAFLAQDMHKIRTVSGHIARAAFVNRRTSELEKNIRSLRGALNRSPYGVILCDENNSVSWYNEKAKGIFRSDDGLSLRHGRLKTRDLGSGESIDFLLSQVVATTSGKGIDNGGFVSIVRPSGRRPYSLTVCPVTESGAWGRAAFAVIFVVDPDNPPAMPTEGFEAFFGVTPAEAKVCQALADGLSIHEAADLLELSINTVRTQVKSIFRKCGVRSQAELIRLLVRVLVAN